MKKMVFVVSIVFLCIILSMFCIACKPIDIGEDYTISVMSYNVRTISVEDSLKGYGLSERLPLIIDKIDTYLPDVIGLQEVNEQHMKGITDMFSQEYDYVIQYRSTWRVALEIPEATPILYKKSKFELLDSGTFWLSETPDVMSRGWDADCHRVCTFVKLKVKATGKIMCFYNTHLDFGKVSVPKSIELIMDTINKDYPCVLIGDFNMTSSNVNYSNIVNRLDDSRVLANVSAEGKRSYNGYSETKGKVIDYCFLSKGDFEVTKYMISNDDFERHGMYASDHFAVLTYLRPIER